MTERPTFILRLRAEPGVVDPIRGLRALLKTALRGLGLRAVDVRLVTISELRRNRGKPSRSIAQIEPEQSALHAERKGLMDMTKYAGSTFIKVEDLAGGSLRKTIADVEEGKFEKPVATFRDGPKLSLNKTNVRTLIRAFGDDSSDWIDRFVELYVGTVSDKNGEPMPSVLVRPVPPPAAAKAIPGPQPARGPMDDEIPFN